MWTGNLSEKYLLQYHLLNYFLQLQASRALLLKNEVLRLRLAGRDVIAARTNLRQRTVHGHGLHVLPQNDQERLSRGAAELLDTRRDSLKGAPLERIFPVEDRLALDAPIDDLLGRDPRL